MSENRRLTSKILKDDQEFNNINTNVEEDYFTELRQNILPSGQQFVYDMIQPFISPVETAKSIGALTSSVANKLFVEGTQENEQLADAVGEYFKERYGGLENIKQAFKKDPFGVVSDIMLVGTGVGAAVKGVGTATKLGGLTKAGQALQTTSRYVDPATLVEKGVGGGLRIGGDTALAIGTAFSGANLNEAFRAGREGGDLQKDFVSQMRGGDPARPVELLKQLGTDFKTGLVPRMKRDIAKNVQENVFDPTEEVGRRPITGVIDGEPRTDLTRTSQGPSVFQKEDMRIPDTEVKDRVDAEEIIIDKRRGDFRSVFDEWQKIKNDDSLWKRSATGEDKPVPQADVTDVFNGIDKLMEETLTDPGLQTLENLNKLQQQLGKFYKVYSQSQNPSDKGLVNKAVIRIQNKVKKSIIDVDETYKEGLDAWTEIYKLQNKLSTDFGIAPNKTDQQILTKIRKIARDNKNVKYGPSLKALEDIDPDGRIVSMVAGADMQQFRPSGSDTASLLRRSAPAIAGGGGVGMDYLSMAGDPLSTLLMVGGATAATSPRLLGEITNLSGRGMRGLDTVGNISGGLLTPGNIYRGYGGLERSALKQIDEEYERMKKDNALGVESIRLKRKSN
tara:strand:- start:1129 stop:2985 length:1857 start_codon:yes stop_codon:yes gene_type:complete